MNIAQHDIFLRLVNISPNIIKSLEVFTNLLLRWGKIHNISGAKDRKAIQAQIEDSLLPINFLLPFQTCIDIGSGAGFPALILACCYPKSQFYLLEPRIKRIAFLENAILTMGIHNVKIIPKFSDHVHDIKADLITSRAVCNSSTLIQKSQHLLVDSGYYLLFKGTNTADEHKTINGLRTQIFTHHQRTFIYTQLHNKNKI